MGCSRGVGAFCERREGFGKVREVSTVVGGGVGVIRERLWVGGENAYLCG